MAHRIMCQLMADDEGEFAIALRKIHHTCRHSDIAPICEGVDGGTLREP